MALATRNRREAPDMSTDIATLAAALKASNYFRAATAFVLALRLRDAARIRAALRSDEPAIQ